MLSHLPPAVIIEASLSLVGGSLIQSLASWLLLAQAVESLYADALEKVRRSALMHVFVAQYMQVYRQNHHVELLHLSAGEAKNPPFDASFWLFQRRRQISQDENKSSNVAAMSVLTRIKFERAKTTSDRAFILATEKQVGVPGVAVRWWASSVVGTVLAMSALGSMTVVPFASLQQ